MIVDFMFDGLDCKIIVSSPKYVAVVNENLQ
jgi:hypothetical protein